MEVPDYPERVHAICARLSTAGDSEWQAIVEELREVLREHDRLIRALAAASLKNSSNIAA